ncbi:Golgi to ER traffic protein 4 homolog isoform X2 [Tachypleus tridentatus]|uniref:Golgi to ER traffic protein 4 homolog isoform X2 n=1 Tax=Tachypleus tridentatus TaxID=6853 RepID=UPI003FD29BDC
MSGSSRERRVGLDRILSKIKCNIETGNYYEAHQMYKTLYFRYLTQKKYKELLDLLYDGSDILLKHHQYNSGADLANLVVDALTTSLSPVSYEYLEKNYAQSRYHFTHSSDGDGCASMLIEYHINKGYPSEVDLFITQAVLQFLCLKNKSTASVVFFTFTEKHPSVQQGPPYLLPLLNFVWFLLLAVEGGRLPVFTVLCEMYQPSINRDPAYPEYLSKIGQIFFGLPAPPKQQGLLNNLVQSLLEGLEEEDISGDSDIATPGPSCLRKHSMQSEDLD